MFGIFKKNSVNMQMPIKGEIIPLTDVPDPAFSEKMLGDGFAIKPENGQVHAPISGKVVQIFPTNHALGLETDGGFQVLIHFGINTVELKGEGFKSHVATGDYVEAGTLLLTVDTDYVTAQNKPLITPIIFTKKESYKSFTVNYGVHLLTEQCCEVKLS